MFCIGFASWLCLRSTNFESSDAPEIHSPEIDDHVTDVIASDIEYIGSACGGGNIYGGRGSGMGFRTSSGKMLGFETSCHLSKRSAQGELRGIIRVAEKVRFGSNNSLESILSRGGRFSLITPDGVEIVTFDGDKCQKYFRGPSLFLSEKLELVIKNREWK